MKRVLSLGLLLVLALSFGAVSAQDDRPYDGTTLNLIYFEQPYFAGLRELVPEFTEQTGISVEIETLAEVPANQKIQLELASQTGNYDIVGTSSANLPLYAANGWLTPVQNFFDTELSNPDQLNLDDFIPSTRDALAQDGTQYCLPYFAATVIMYYQISAFEEAGITEPPATFDELLEVAAAINSDEVPAIAMRGNPGAAGNVWHWNLFLRGEGGSLFADFPNDLTPTLDSPEAIAATNAFIELKQQYSPEGAANYTFDDVVIAMQQGRVAIAIEGAPLAGRILDPEQSQVVDNVGFAVVPGGAAGQMPPFVSHGLCIAADSENAEAAYLFLEWATSADVFQRIATSTAHVAVTRNSVWEDADFIAKYDYDYGGGSFLAAFQESLNLAPFDYYPAFPAWTAIGDIIGLAIQEIEIGSKSVEDGLRDANDAIRQLLEDEGYL